MPIFEQIARRWQAQLTAVPGYLARLRLASYFQHFQHFVRSLYFTAANATSGSIYSRHQRWHLPLAQHMRMQVTLRTWYCIWLQACTVTFCTRAARVPFRVGSSALYNERAQQSPLEREERHEGTKCTNSLLKLLCSSFLDSRLVGWQQSSAYHFHITCEEAVVKIERSEIQFLTSRLEVPQLHRHRLYGCREEQWAKRVALLNATGRPDRV